MTGQEIRERFRLEQIAHHYFYTGTMARFPLLIFDKDIYPENHAKLQAVIEAEREAGRLEAWDTGTPEPFEHLREELYRN